MTRRIVFYVVGGASILICLACMAFAIYFGSLVVRSGPPQDISLNVDAPVMVQKGNTFAIATAIHNNATLTKTLEYVQVDRAYLDGIPIHGIEPLVSRTSTNFLTKSTSFYFQQEI